ncbi:MAG: amidohydrolase family protein, partial [Maritimibacter sp.]
LRGTVLHPAQLWWLATAGSARALRLDDKIGTLAAGMEADLAEIDLAATPAIAQRAGRAESLWEEVFPTIMMGDDRSIAATYVAGKLV